MLFNVCGSRLSFRGLIAVLIVVFLSSQSPPFVLAQTDAEGHGVEQIFRPVWECMSRQDYPRAIQLADEIIASYSDTEEIVCRAYDWKVLGFIEASDQESAEAAAREKLRKFPGHNADPYYFGETLNELYSALRAEMFGSVTFVEPKNAEVFVDSVHVGTIADVPLSLQYVPVGTHTLRIMKSGYQDHEEEFQVLPSDRAMREISLQRERDTKWWLLRGGVFVALAGTVTALIVKDGKSTDDVVVEPLPAPPPPPATSN